MDNVRTLPTTAALRWRIEQETPAVEPSAHDRFAEMSDAFGTIESKGQRRRLRKQKARLESLTRRQQRSLKRGGAR